MNIVYLMNNQVDKLFYPAVNFTISSKLHKWSLILVSIAGVTLHV